MRYAVLGTGTVGRAVAAKLASLGHEVTIGTRDPQATLARAESDATGTVPFAQWHQANPGVRLAAFADAAASAGTVVNATSGAGALEALSLARADNLAGKPLLDIANPLDFSQGVPPSLNPVNTDSLGEQIQRAFPEAKVVKTLNTMSAHVMVDPAQVAGEHNVFVSGNDADTKKAVAELLVSFGWPATSVLDLGDITTARGTEMLLPIWLRLWGALGHTGFNFHVQGAHAAV